MVMIVSAVHSGERRSPEPEYTEPHSRSAQQCRSSPRCPSPRAAVGPRAHDSRTRGEGMAVLRAHAAVGQRASSNPKWGLRSFVCVARLDVAASIFAIVCVPRPCILCVLRPDGGKRASFCLLLHPAPARGYLLGITRFAAPQPQLNSIGGNETSLSVSRC